MITLSEHVLNAYAARRCFICEEYGACPHREFAVEAAFILAEWNRRVTPSRPKAKPLLVMNKKGASS